MIFSKSIIPAFLLCLISVQMVAARGCFALSCAGAQDNLYQRIQEVKRWCVDPTSNMCRVGKNNCRVAKSECDSICRQESRTCPGACPP
ncbi:MAG: hypothetical protein J3R72DRAFT_264215 [Linnemannia gamsii]|nr:MAG: hypothetical protein J3R72DRAFT_264215 [Linnemannia gamsii]